MRIFGQEEQLSSRPEDLYSHLPPHSTGMARNNNSKLFSPYRVILVAGVCTRGLRTEASIS
jgi:hypothetical protein